MGRVVWGKEGKYRAQGCGEPIFQYTTESTRENARHSTAHHYHLPEHLGLPLELLLELVKLRCALQLQLRGVECRSVC